MLSQANKKMLSNMRKITNDNQITKVILFDGVCNFCNSGVDALAYLDRKKQFKFKALQSDEGKYLLERVGRSGYDISSIVLVEYDSINATPSDAHIKSYFIKSNVVIEVLNTIGFPYSIISRLVKFIPLKIRDRMYDFIANNRYSILGKREICRCSVDNEPFT